MADDGGKYNTLQNGQAVSIFLPSEDEEDVSFSSSSHTSCLVFLVFLCTLHDSAGASEGGGLESFTRLVTGPSYVSLVVSK